MMMKNIKLSASQEDYLEAIFHISREKQAARAKDIALRLDVRASSVTNALRALSSIGLINYAPYDLITLTTSGLTVAREIVGRHEALSDFLISVLGIDPVEADLAACKMEHTVTKSIIDRLIKYADYVKHCPRGGITWESGFGYYCKTGCAPQQCERLRPIEKDTNAGTD
jgi:DtxR family Mn-dependent transcriptional regulator